ncbi:MAG: site-2 protease family protein [Actinobacteria bacterium]|nr:site-2 protease family protein [Actinomycetota bacterium]
MGTFGQTIIDFLRQLITWLPGLAIGVIMHEYAHGYVAYKSGDPTAKNYGRLTLNPIAHIDLFGSILLPVLLILLNSGIIFGYARPVPINPAYFRNYRKGLRYTSLAGPATNLIIAFIAGLAYGLFFYLIFRISGGFFDINSIGYRSFDLIKEIFSNMIYINIFLAIFNFIPIPPLDGSKILASFLPEQAMYRFLSIGRFGFIFIFIFLFLGGRIFWSVISPVFNFLYNAATWWQYLLPG